MNSTNPPIKIEQNNNQDPSKLKPIEQKNDIIINDEIAIVISIDDSNTSNACWIRVIADNKEIFSGTLKAGQSETFKAKDMFKIRFGNPGPVKVKFNGVDQGAVGTEGRPIEKTFSK
ncbi:hypothetical protein SDC9_208322 [bioreactor metagenome]|uniref:Cytoskeleton protein RodZ-like C-terminal domain-containing protein n=1 Tax=bioreactor metagenome TaxID=1076179 RepID=A0A645JLT6_9ZZZZ